MRWLDEWSVLPLVLLAVMSTYSLVGLVAVWGAQRCGHWFFRMAAVLGLSAVWLFTADRRLCLLFLSQTCVVVLRLRYLQDRAARTGPDVTAASVGHSGEPASRRFSLNQLLLAVALLSGIFALLARLPRQVRWDWYLDVLPGAILGLFTLVAVWAAQSDRSPWLRAATLVVSFPALLMGVWLWLAHSARGPIGRTIAAAYLFVIAILPATLYHAEFKAQALAYPPRLVDNGYADLLRAAEMVDDPTVNIDKLSDDELLGFLQERAVALELARKALHRPCQALLYESMNDLRLGKEAKRLRKLSEILAAQGQMELQKGRITDAVESYLADIELGAAMTNGGVLIHDAVGFQVEDSGVRGLEEVVAQLDDDACQKLAERLAEIDERREPPENVAARERFYYAGTYPWKHRINSLARTLFPDEPFTIDHLMETAAGEKRAKLRLLVAHLALRRFWLERKEYPEMLHELIPRYLSAVPLDPFADRELTYKKLATGYLLYSIGQDHVDDSGAPAKPLARRGQKGDVVLKVGLSE